MIVTFHNVRIDLTANDPVQAYDALCRALQPLVDGGALEYETDTFSTDKDSTQVSTRLLWPAETGGEPGGESGETDRTVNGPIDDELRASVHRLEALIQSQGDDIRALKMRLDERGE